MESGLCPDFVSQSFAIQDFPRQLPRGVGKGGGHPDQRIASWARYAKLAFGNCPKSYLSSSPTIADTTPPAENTIPKYQYIRWRVSSVTEVMTSPISSSASARS